MSDKILDQDLTKKSPDRPQMLMAQLLFREKPPMAEKNALKSALEKLVGETETVGDKPEMPMFAVQKYKAVFKDQPQGIPVLADYLLNCEFDAKANENIDEIIRSQFWDVENGEELLDSAKWCVGVFAMVSSVLHYKQQAELFLAQIDAALQCYPTCEAIYVVHSGKLTTPEQFEDCKRFDLAGRFIRLAVNARFFNIGGTEDKLVDTLGLNAFGAADVQVHFRGLNPDHVVNYVYNIASYQFGNEFPVKSGDTLDSIAPDGSMQWEPQWHAQYENSLIQPVRPVLDINCGEFAAGNRSN